MQPHRTHSHKQIEKSEQLSKELDEQAKMMVLQNVHKLNKTVLLKMMDDYEGLAQSKQTQIQPEILPIQDTKKTKQFEELARSTYLNFVQDSLRKSAASGNFTDLVMAQYRVVQSLKLKKIQTQSSCTQQEMDEIVQSQLEVAEKNNIQTSSARDHDKYE